MNVYDFDGTLYPGNCIVSFGFWCMNRQPTLWVRFFPRAVKLVIQYKMGKIPKAKMFLGLFGFLRLVNDFDNKVERFWDEKQHKIASWYLAQKQPDDLIISAAPTVVIEPMMRRLGVEFMASEYDREAGVLLNNFMYAREKALYIADHGFPKIDAFYSDSLSDTPLALCAEKAYLVTDNASVVRDWPELNEETKKEVRRAINIGWKIHLD